MFMRKNWSANLANSCESYVLQKSQTSHLRSAAVRLANWFAILSLWRLLCAAILPNQPALNSKLTQLSIQVMCRIQDIR